MFKYRRWVCTKARAKQLINKSEKEMKRINKWINRFQLKTHEQWDCTLFLNVLRGRSLLLSSRGLQTFTAARRKLHWEAAVENWRTGKDVWHIELRAWLHYEFHPGLKFSPASETNPLKSNCRLIGEGFSPARNSAWAKNPSPVFSNRAKILSPAKRAEKST